jgi:hypothetical protein
MVGAGIFSVITNTIEDMENPRKTMLKSMMIAT